MSNQWKSLLLLLLIVGQAAADTDAKQAADVYPFEAEVGRLMDILINSLYTHKEVFLRELISNASDALDKLRYLAVQNPDILKEYPNLEILIEFNKAEKTLSVTDTGIGMTKNDLIQNLGTIARSGTTNFMEAIKGGNVNIIGQFGVGFYSAFLVAQQVEVTSKNPNDEQHVWESTAASSFKVYKDDEGEALPRGTRVKLLLKQDAEEFLDEAKLKELIKRYSEFINFPIKLRITKEVEREVTDDEAEAEEEPAEKKSDDEDQEKEEKKKATKKVKENVQEWKVINDNKAIWTRDKSTIRDDEYKKFYKQTTKDYDDPMSWIHFRAEGEVVFTSLLFIPKKAQHDQFENYYGPSQSLKLYVRRVLINEEFEDLMPRYLNFIKGLVDSDDLPINVSRESIQHLKMLKVISRKLVRKALEMIRQMAEYKDDEEEVEEEEEEETTDTSDEEGTSSDNSDDSDDEDDEEDRLEAKKKRYDEFWKEYGKNIKLGIIEDSANRPKLAQYSRWYSTNNPDELTSLDDYLSRAKPGQDNIYFIAGESKEQLVTNPTLQKLLQKKYEVLLLDDPIDEFTFQHLTEYEKKRITNVAKGDFKFPEDDDNERQKFKKLKKVFKPLTDWWKKLLPAELENVRLSQRLVNDPCVVVSSEYGYSPSMERISKAQAYAQSERSNPYLNQKRVLEVNPSHPAIQSLLEKVKDDPDKDVEELAKVLYEGSLVNSGYALKDPTAFSVRFYKLFNAALGLERDAPVRELEIDLDDISDGDDDDDKRGPRRPKPEAEELDLDDEDEPVKSDEHDTRDL
jgi:heat shock protein beta